jgi:hypothetical protein
MRRGQARTNPGARHESGRVGQGHTIATRLSQLTTHPYDCDTLISVR